MGAVRVHYKRPYQDQVRVHYTMFISWRSRPIKTRGGERSSSVTADPPNVDSTWFAWQASRCDHSGPDRVAWTAFLIRAERVDGKPRQQILLRIPTIRSCCIADARTRTAWWSAIELSYEGWQEYIGGIDEGMNRDWPACMAKLREVVPAPSRKAKADHARFAAESDRAREEHRKAAERRRQEEDQEREQRQAAEEFVRLIEEILSRAEEDRRSEGSFHFRHDPVDSATLGVDPSATPAEIKARFRALAKVHHPDKGGDAAEFARLREAHDRILKAACPPGA